MSIASASMSLEITSPLDMTRAFTIINRTITSLFAAFFCALGAFLFCLMTYGFVTIAQPNNERIVTATIVIDILGFLLFVYGGALFWFLKKNTG